jgi:hypothetical protein
MRWVWGRDMEEQSRDAVGVFEGLKKRDREDGVGV